MDALFIFLLFFTFLVAVAQRSLGRLDKKKRSSSKFKQNFAPSSFSRSRTSPTVTAQMSLTLLPYGHFTSLQEHLPLLCVSLDCPCSGRGTASPCVFAHSLGQWVLTKARTGANVVQIIVSSQWRIGCNCAEIWRSQCHEWGLTQVHSLAFMWENLDLNSFPWKHRYFKSTFPSG